MNGSTPDLDTELALALTHWLEAAERHTADPVAGSRALEQARRHLAALFVREGLPTLKDGTSLTRRCR
jgi:hypothetical protein